jgi:hypothetical protein
MRVHRLLIHGLSNEPLWVRLYVQPMGDQWTAMIVADSVDPPKPGELKGTGFFANTPAEAKDMALRYLEQN